MEREKKNLQMGKKKRKIISVVKTKRETRSSVALGVGKSVPLVIKKNQSPLLLNFYVFLTGKNKLVFNEQFKVSSSMNCST